MRKILYILYQPYKWGFFLPFMFLNTLLFGAMAVLISVFINQKAGSYWGGAVWSRLNSFLTPMRVKVYGKENINKNTSYVIISNHQSHYDIFVIYGWLGLDIKWVMKQELRRIPGLGIGSEKVGHIFIDRSNNKVASESLKKAIKNLAKGSSVAIFAEGTRSKTGELGIFKRGAFKMALNAGLPILPITVIGTKDILPSNTFDVFPGKAKLFIHQPIDIKKYSETEINKLMTDVREIISIPLTKELKV